MEDDEAGVSNREESIGNLYLLLASFRYSWFHETVPSVAELKATKKAKSIDTFQGVQQAEGGFSNKEQILKRKMHITLLTGFHYHKLKKQHNLFKKSVDNCISVQGEASISEIPSTN